MPLLGTFGSNSIRGIRQQKSGAGLYAFSTATFTSGNNNGPTGPSLTQARAGLTGTGTDAWKNNTEFFNTTNGIQLWTVPANGTYTIEAWGAQGGGSNGGLGARMRGDFELTEGEIIRIIAGQRGNNGNSVDQNSQGGGGGSFVVRTPFNTNPSILVIAGGGGGSQGTYSASRNAPTGTSGNNGVGVSASGAGGTGGNGGAGTSRAGGGGGFFTNGASASGTNGQGGVAFVNGGQGGIPTTGGEGGFGGGAATWQTGFRGSGGGGGYSGGGGATQSANTTNHSGGGGGSFNSGTNQSNSAGVRTGPGQVQVTLL